MSTPDIVKTLRTYQNNRTEEGGKPGGVQLSVRQAGGVVSRQVQRLCLRWQDWQQRFQEG